MSKKVLVVYGSKYGSTAEIAEKIGAVIREGKHKVDVLPADKVGSTAGYDAVVTGSALYMGKWLKDVQRFVEAHEEELAKKQMWVFASGPIEDGDPVENIQGWFYPKKLAAVFERIKPVDVTAFGGMVDDAKLSRFEKFVLKKVKASSGDFRDWEQITRWAETIASAL